jgi:hypothetical protein
VQIRLPNRIEFKWVKGHQSSNLGGATWALSQEARLNEEADKLASAIIVNRERQKTPVEPERWPAQIVVLSDSNGSITGDLAKSIRAKMHSEAVQQYFQGKYDWDNHTWHSIDHASVTTAIRRLTPTDRRRLVQLRSGWLPVNSRLAKFMPERFAHCPRCVRSLSLVETPETIDHLLRCPTGTPNILVWINNDFQQLLRTLQTPWNMVKAFTKGLTLWANGEEPGTFGDPTEFPSLAIRQAITSQTRIGWHHVLQGFIAKEWEQIYELSAGQNGVQFHRNWTSTVYSALFAFFCSTWKNRNEAMHGRDQEDCDRITKARLFRRVENIYTVRDSLRAEDRSELFGYPIEYFQGCSITALRNYVGYAEAVLPAALQRAVMPRGQRTITQYFKTPARVWHSGAPGAT